MRGLAQRCVDNLLVCAAVCFIAGASVAFVCARALAQLPVVSIVAPLSAVAAASALFLDRRRRPLAALPFLLLVGLLHTHLALQPSSDPHHISRLIDGKTKITLVGRIQTMPEFDGEKTRFDLAMESLLVHTPERNASFQPARGLIQLSVANALDPRFAPGVNIMAMATVDRIRNYQTPGAFDYRLLMAAKSITCSGWIQSADEMLPVRDQDASFWRDLRYLPERTRQRIAQTLDRRLTPELAGLYQALLIGQTVNISPQIMEAFKENGCFHALSISGLHFSMLGLFAAGLFIWLLKRSQWLLLHTHAPTLALALTAPFLLLYAFIAGMNVPAVRALLTALLALFAVAVRRQRSMIHLIAAAALVVLAISPLSLASASFQLSFAAVLAINLIYPRLPLLADKPKTPRQGWRDHLLTGISTVQSMLYVSLAATAGSLPILLYHFNRFSLIGPAMNLLIEPLLCLWALPCGLLAIPLIWIAPDAASLLFDFGGLGIRLTIWLAEAMRGFPYASIWTITPSLLEIGLFFGVLLVLLRPRLTLRRLGLAGFMAGALAFSFTLSLWRPQTSKELAVDFLDVGQGASTLLHLPDGKNILLDGGGYQTERFDPGQSLIAPFLWRKRIWRLDGLIITHPHGDHYNGLPFVAARFQPRRLIVNGDVGEEPGYERLLNEARRANIPIQTASAGDLLEQGDNLRLHCLGMPGINETSAASTNDRSLVLHLQYGSRSLLLPADVGFSSEAQLLQAGASLRADVLLAPHHGSRTSASEGFVAAVNPALIVVSAGQRQQGVIPSPAHLERWRQQKISTLITAQSGTVTVNTDGKDLRARTFTGNQFVWDGNDRLSPAERPDL